MRISFYVVCSCAALAYNIPNAKCQKHPLRRGEMNRALTNTFNKLVAANPNAGEVANYVTLDAVNATFIAKSTLPIWNRHDNYIDTVTQRTRYDALPPEEKIAIQEKLGQDSGTVSYLSFTVNGGLIDKNYGALFSNSSLNAGVGLAAQYNFRFRTKQFTYRSSAWKDISIKRDQLIRTHAVNRIATEQTMNRASVERTKTRLQLQKLSAEDKLGKKQVQIDLVQKTIDSLGADIANRPGLGDTLLSYVKEADALQKEVDIASMSIDSINGVGPYITSLKDLQVKSLKDKLKSDYDTVISEATLEIVEASWFTLTGGYARKSFTTFYDSLPFNMQIDDDNRLDGWNLGAAVNYLKQNRLTRRTLFLNGAVSWRWDNNLSRLSATAIEQAKRIVNSGGDTTRTITKKYNAYTEPVERFHAVNFTGHAYYLWGKMPSGIHFSPSVDVQDNGHEITDMTLGYLISFQNTVKDQPIVNAEVYFRFKDVLNDAKEKNDFHQRNEFGITFTVPFNIF